MLIHVEIVEGQMVFTNTDGGPAASSRFGKLDRMRLAEFLRRLTGAGWNEHYTSSASMDKAKANGWPDDDAQGFLRECIRESKR